MHAGHSLSLPVSVAIRLFVSIGISLPRMVCVPTAGRGLCAAERLSGVLYLWCTAMPAAQLCFVGLLRMISIPRWRPS